MAKNKNYSLRTRDMYHPLYSTYQLDYLRPNVWEIVIGTSSPTTYLSTAPGSIPSLGRGTTGRRVTDNSYSIEGHQVTSTFSSQAAGGLSLYCSKFSLNLPKSNVIQVPWISGVTQLAGRNNQAFTINAEFYAGLGSKSIGSIIDGSISTLGSNVVTDDVLRLLYAWRNLCFDARTGQIGLAPNYKKPATIFMYDPSGVKIIYEFTVHGLWPSELANIELDVSSDDIVKISATMQADFVYLADDDKTMDDFFNLTIKEVAGASSVGILEGKYGSNSGSSGSSNGTAYSWDRTNSNGGGNGMG